MSNTQEQTTATVVLTPVNDIAQMNQRIDRLTNLVERLVDRDGSELMSRREACGMLKIGMTTLDRYIKDGRLPSTSAGKGCKRMVRRADIEKMLIEYNS